MQGNRRFKVYGIEIFSSIHMPVDWYMIYWGIKNGQLNVKTAQDYVCMKIEQNEMLKDEELELSWQAENILDVLDIIERILGSDVINEENMKEAKNRVRISILIFLRQTIHDIALLLEKIELVYANFEYPEDMDKFISYMPIQDEVDYLTNSVDENRSYLLKNFDLFIEQQKEKYELKV